MGRLTLGGQNAKMSIEILIMITGKIAATIAIAIQIRNRYNNNDNYNKTNNNKNKICKNREAA